MFSTTKSFLNLNAKVEKKRSIKARNVSISIFENSILKTRLNVYCLMITKIPFYFSSFLVNQSLFLINCFSSIPNVFRDLERRKIVCISTQKLSLCLVFQHVRIITKRRCLHHSCFSIRIIKKTASIS